MKTMQRIGVHMHFVIDVVGSQRGFEIRPARIDSRIVLCILNEQRCTDAGNVFALFGLLTLGLNLVTGGRSWRCGPLNLYWGATLVFVVAALEELSQAWFPNRTLDITDLMADVVGILVFSWLSRALLRRVG